MKRNRMEACRYAVRPLLIYLILFVAVRSVLMELLRTAAVTFSYDALPDYPVWYTAAETAVIGISSACAALPLLKEGKSAVMTLRARRMSAFIARRKDSRFLMGILPIGTVCLSALMNLLLAGKGETAPVPVPYAELPLRAAVYGILTPFTEELVYRGVVWYRLRKEFPAVQAALLSSLLFGIAHADLRQGAYAFVMGMVFSLSYGLTYRFEVPFLLHALCNLAVLAASYAGWGEVLGSPMWTTFFAVTAFMVFAYWWIRYDRARQTHDRAKHKS